MAKQTYLALLLRFWRVDSGSQSVWRASLEDAHTGERRGFSDLPALQVFLQTLLEAHSGDEAETARPPCAEQ